MLYIFGGLPATGKTEISRYLAATVSAAYIRIDTIEQQLREQGFINLYDEAYQLAFLVALDNLKNGISVVADSTNPVKESRQAWVKVAKQAQTSFTEIEIICSDKQEHRKRVETRITDIPKLLLPDWESVISRDYQKWLSPDIVLDTATKTPEQSKHELMQLLRSGYQK
ncbi:AAA family ATPase [uncultured Paraglaciecola sp.]|uniref:AAA family ATPase n=1 Tax=uncultured Paraglaciecola sp. TaxID=1765024 RepID=UPI0030D754B1|tara:strand:+ start:75348 stop:75854 length:507 start_codon:yes stop_codon:yes gene_type:complete